jgi:cysteine desulfurase
MIYLDHAATTPMRPEVRDAMAPFARHVFGNTSGVHEVSRRAKDALEEVREMVASSIGAHPTEIVFTSGGTESDNLALKGPVLAGPRTGVVTVATEHDAVLETVRHLGRYGRVSVVGVGPDGLVDPDALVAEVDDDTAVVSVMAVNNETGVVQDVAGIAALVHETNPGVLVHTDAAQAFSCLPVDVTALGVDMITLSGHKVGGPKGVGVLYVRDGVQLEPLVHGGGQEMGRRSGTHDVAGAVGMAVALEAAAADRVRFVSAVGGLRDDFEKRLAPGVGAVVNGEDGPRSPHHSNLRIPGVRNDTLLMRLDRDGVAASAGSACQSGAPDVSHVLSAMGLSTTEIRESLRFSFGWDTTQDDAARAAEILVEIWEGLR